MTGRALVIALAVVSAAAAGRVAAEEVGPEYHQARQWFQMGSIARRLEDYDLAIRVYQRIIERFPDTRWAQQAERTITAIKAEAQAHLAPWDPEVGGTAGAVQASKLLQAGDMAYQMDDMLIALKFYERAQYAASDSRYARQAASKMRWIRRWRNPGP